VAILSILVHQKLLADGGGGQHSLYSNLFRTKEKPGGKRGWRLSGFLLYLKTSMTQNFKIKFNYNLFVVINSSENYPTANIKKKLRQYII